MNILADLFGVLLELLELLELLLELVLLVLLLLVVVLFILLKTVSRMGDVCDGTGDPDTDMGILVPYNILS